MSENEYPKVGTIDSGWCVDWGNGKPVSPMPDEATARRCAASAKMLEALVRADGLTMHPSINSAVRAAISAATGGE